MNGRLRFDALPPLRAAAANWPGVFFLTDTWGPLTLLAVFMILSPEANFKEFSLLISQLSRTLFLVPQPLFPELTSELFSFFRREIPGLNLDGDPAPALLPEAFRSAGAHLGRVLF